MEKTMHDLYEEREPQEQKGMTLQEAINSGKPFRRSPDGPYLENFLNLKFSIEDVLSDNWEVKPAMVILTREGLGKAWKLAARAVTIPQTDSAPPQGPSFAVLCEVLGL
jgi:hypothetical protein